MPKKPKKLNSRLANLAKARQKKMEGAGPGAWLFLMLAM
jgi:hypothetical protein